MSVSVTVAQLQEKIRTRMDLPAYSSTTFISTDEILDMVKTSAQMLSGIIDAAWGEHYFTTSTNLSTVANTSTVPLPSNFGNLIKLAWRKSATEPRIFLEQANLEAWDPYPSNWTDVTPKYRVIGESIELFPTPDAVYTLPLYYSTGIFVTQTSDTIPIRVGWDEWLVLDVCIKILQKQDLDASQLLAQRERVEAIVRQNATRRDRSKPRQVRDVRGMVMAPGDIPWWRL